MKMLLMLCLPFLLLFTNRGCDDQKAPADGPTSLLGDTLVLTQGQALSLASEKIKLTYTKNDDNRCPEGVNCIVAGKAQISLSIDQAPETATIQLEVKGLCQDRHGACGNTVSHQGYQYQILSADPYPQSPANSNTSTPATIRLIVQKGNS